MSILQLCIVNKTFVFIRRTYTAITALGEDGPRAYKYTHTVQREATCTAQLGISKCQLLLSNNIY